MEYKKISAEISDNQPKHKNKGNNSGVCLECRTSLKGMRTSAKFCCDTCRNDYNNSKRNYKSSTPARKKKLQQQSNKKIPSYEKNYTVYAAINTDEPDNYLYIGSGLPKRYLHCNSGTSHNYDLNRLHHTGVNISCVILHSELSKPESILLEINLIEKYKPPCNRQYLKKGE